MYLRGEASASASASELIITAAASPGKIGETSDRSARFGSDDGFAVETRVFSRQTWVGVGARALVLSLVFVELPAGNASSEEEGSMVFCFSSLRKFR